MDSNGFVAIVNECLHTATVQLAEWLERVIPKSHDWWDKYVVSKLSLELRKDAIDKGYSSLKEFDLSALIYIAKSNLNVICDDLFWCNNFRYTLGTVKDVRNKWAHHNGTEPNKNTTIQDLEAILDLFKFIGVSTEPIEGAIKNIKGRQIPIGKNEGKRPTGRENRVFAETFTFTNEPASIRGKSGYKAYNSYGKYIGIVYMTDDKRSPSFECAELCMLPNYYNVYGEWHRIKSHGGRIKWQVLCDRLSKNGKYECYID